VPSRGIVLPRVRLTLGMSTAPGPRAAQTTVPLTPLLAERWSPRSFDDAHRLAPDELTALLEAARWAPSAGNSQPTRFLVAHRGDDAHAGLVELLAPGNRAWAPAASALVLVLAEESDAQGRPRPWASYDAGLAVAQLTVQAQALGLGVHQMGGFDRAGAAGRLDLPAGLRPLVVLAVGRPADAARLPAELAAREQAPRERRPLGELLVRSAAQRRAA
jgi:nitroreductase